MIGRATLRRRMILSLGSVLLGLIVVAIGAVVAIDSVHADMGAAVRGQQQLKTLFNIGFLASKARGAIAAQPMEREKAVDALRLAENEVAGGLGPTEQAEFGQLIGTAIDEIENGSRSGPSLNLLFLQLSRSSDQIQQAIVAEQTAAGQERHVAIASTIGLCCVVIVGTIVIGIRQYWSVIRPIAELGLGARAFAKGRFAVRIEENGDAEFLNLARDFNTMASELEMLYRDLEGRIASKTRELMQSERLASVGYLAAGVAHEINNPLGIIAGYGERATQQLSRGVDDRSTAAVIQALSVIGEEVFRCKEIIEQLLSLARPGAAVRGQVSVAELLRGIVATLSKLGSIGDRSLTLSVEPGEGDARVTGNEGELKQVFLNLIINALEAVNERGGEVRIAVRPMEETVQIQVSDNGAGMSGETLYRVFEPFYTEKRGTRAGSGLGLAIVHAIVVNHGGGISADSAGPGRGSRFVVTLPVATTEVADAAI